MKFPAAFDTNLSSSEHIFAIPIADTVSEIRDSTVNDNYYK